MPGRPEIFVIGDLAALRRDETRWIPQLAPFANQGGRSAAKNIMRSLRHILYLAGFRNQVSVMFEWLWSYVTMEHGSRLMSAAAYGQARTEETSSAYASCGAASVAPADHV